MKKRVTINDIARELDMSRNTVSKVLNGHPMPSRTRNLVLEKAIELGYKSMGVVSKSFGYLRNQKILLITSRPLTSLNYFMAILRGIEETVRKYNFELIQYTLNENTTARELNDYLKLLNISGIICLESFDQSFIKHLINLKLPTVFVDFLAGYSYPKGNYDIVTSNNMMYVYKVCNALINEHNITTWGFVGDDKHCLGFQERYLGLKQALSSNNIVENHYFHITEPDHFSYGDVSAMVDLLKRMETLPRGFICANDFIAQSLSKALLQLKYKIPQDVVVVGFDDTIEAKVTEVPLTTIGVDKNFLGKETIRTLIHRIKHPKEKCRTIYLESKIIQRKSTLFCHSL